MAEAMNELAFLSVGMFGKTHAQAGRRADPGHAAVEIRIQVGQIDRQGGIHRQTPAKLLAAAAGERVRLLGQREPGGAASRVGARRRRDCSGSNEMVPTQIWNGYGEYVARLYDDLKNERLFA